ncbi:O-antigen ligase family protein [Aminobacter sp. AP02]|uniref:O-antigen ligase family protein n=1 Tax=Aminobacter sp. AP02 TaxID=2135737 RepID=UPI001304E263|nr:O-antigen ligase family protein [Aminobacter sp. AP02]
MTHDLGGFDQINGIEQNRSRRKTAARDDGEQARKSLPWPVLLFLISLLIPWIISIGPLRMSAYRFVLIGMLIPCLIMWLGGKAGRIRIADISLILYCFWCFLAIIMIHGFAYAIQPAGMIFIETVGAYLLARCFIRDADDFYNVIVALFWIVAMLLPLSVFEAVTGRNIAREFFASLYQTVPDSYLEPRWGLRRVQSIFEHPILYGVFCASILTLVHLVLGHGKSLTQRWLKTATVGIAAFLSLSAGPMTALAAQAMLLGWNWVFNAVEARWRILGSFALLAVVSIELLSNRSVPVIFVSYFAFDEQSARVRIEIWRYGSASALNHPLFGVGFNEWERAPWMTTSIDMFWIIDAVRHGIPAEFLMMLAFFAVYLPVAFKKGLTERLSVFRTAFVISMTGFFLVGWTVYFWNATYVIFLFMLGSGVWLLDQQTHISADQRRTPMRAMGKSAASGPRQN